MSSTSAVLTKPELDDRITPAVTPAGSSVRSVGRRTGALVWRFVKPAVAIVAFLALWEIAPGSGSSTRCSCRRSPPWSERSST